MKFPTLKISLLGLFCCVLWFNSCTQTLVVESPKTAFVTGSEEPKTPTILWTSRTMGQKFGYLGRITARSWSWDGAIKRLIEGGKELRADAIIDVHYEKTGFLTTMQAFAIKFKE